MFTPILGEMIQFDLHIFLRWVGEKPPTRFGRSTKTPGKAQSTSFAHQNTKTSPKFSGKPPFFVKNLGAKKMVIPLIFTQPSLKKTNPLNIKKLRLRDRSNHRGFVVLNLVSGVQTWNANPVGEAQLENKTRSSVGTGGVQSEDDLPGINLGPQKK